MSDEPDLDYAYLFRVDLRSMPPQIVLAAAVRHLAALRTLQPEVADRERAIEHIERFLAEHAASVSATAPEE